MENASKALMIAAGILIAIMILSLGATLFFALSSYVKTSQDRIKSNEITTFNNQFLKYSNSDGEYTIHDIISVANIAYENNLKYGAEDNSSPFYVTVYLKNKGDSKKAIENEIKNTEFVKNLLENNIENLKSGSIKKIKYVCQEIHLNQDLGRVDEIYFIQEIIN